MFIFSFTTRVPVKFKFTPLCSLQKIKKKKIKPFHLIKLFTFTSVKTAYIVFFDLTRVKKFGNSKFLLGDLTPLSMLQNRYDLVKRFKVC